MGFFNSWDEAILNIRILHVHLLGEMTVSIDMIVSKYSTAMITAHFTNESLYIVHVYVGIV